MMMTRIFAAALAAVGLSAAAVAAEGEAHAPENHEWSFEGPFGTFDRHAVQRGFQIYQEVCSSCHSMDLMRFRNLGQKGGPFEAEEFPNPNDNPIVMQIAASYQVQDGPNDDGDMFMRAGLPSDAFPAPFDNEQQARASNGGALPPDLSLIVKARSGGADYVRSLLLGYIEPPEDAPPVAGPVLQRLLPGRSDRHGAAAVRRYRDLCRRNAGDGRADGRGRGDLPHLGR